MIYTSYYANSHRFKENYKKVSISLYAPYYAKIDIQAIELAPTKEILMDYKNGKINKTEYTERFINEVLTKLDPKEIAQKYDNSILLCYEKKGDFCHRHIVADWLNKTGFKCNEL